MLLYIYNNDSWSWFTVYLLITTYIVVNAWLLDGIHQLVLTLLDFVVQTYRVIEKVMQNAYTQIVSIKGTTNCKVEGL